MKNRRKIILIACFSIFILNLNNYIGSGTLGSTVQTDAHYSVDWETIIRSSDYDLGKRLVQTTDNGFIVVGCRVSGSAHHDCAQGKSDVDGYVVKLDSNGKLIWNRTYGSSGNDKFHAVIKTMDDNYMLAGETNSYGAGADDVWIVNIDTDGIVLWNKTFGLPDADRAFDIISSGNDFLLTGFFHPIVGEGGQMFLLKMDKNGNFLWNKTYSGTDRSFSIASGSENGFIIAGGKDDDFFIMKVDDQGNQQWNNSFGGFAYDIAECVISTPDGGFLAGGNTASYGAGQADALLIKVDKDGKYQWNSTLGGTGNEFVNKILNYKDGGFLVSIHTTSSSLGPGYGDNWLVKLDQNGNKEWSQSTGYDNGDDFAFDLKEIGEDKYILAGRTQSNSIYSDFWIFQISFKLDNSSSIADSSTDSSTQTTDSSTQTTPGFQLVSFSCIPIILIFKRKFFK